jgi:flavin-dependent dehydrogenase
MACILVIGAGPAGSVFATHMAGYGHDVTLIDRKTFPRLSLGESLTPGVQELLAVVDAGHVLEQCETRPLTEVLLDWDEAAYVKSHGDTGAMSVDRGQFDAALMAHAARSGVEVRQPARLLKARLDGANWQVTLEVEGRAEHLRADYLAYATGRAGKNPSRVYEPVRTIALYGYWRTKGDTPLPQLRARAACWAWGVPLPTGLYNALIFADPATIKAQDGQSLDQRFQAMLSACDMGDAGALGNLAGPVRALDATPFLDEAPMDGHMVRLGDNAMALDPVSSSGVQKSIQSALAAAVCVNTELCRQDQSAAARAFYRDSLRRTAHRHAAWTGAHYARVLQRFGTGFWSARAGPQEAPDSAPDVLGRHIATGTLQLCRQAQIADTPTVGARYVETRPALFHPHLEEPVAFLGGVDLAPLLRRFPSHMTGLEVARSWSDLVPTRTALSILAWLLKKGVVFHVGD